MAYAAVLQLQAVASNASMLAPKSYTAESTSIAAKSEVVSTPGDEYTVAAPATLAPSRSAAVNAATAKAVPNAAKAVLNIVLVISFNFSPSVCACPATPAPRLYWTVRDDWPLTAAAPSGN